MDSCFWIPLFWVIGASILSGLLGWYLAKKTQSKLLVENNTKDLEIQNLKREVMTVQEKADKSLATLGREHREIEEKATLWREKFNKLQLQSAGIEHNPEVEKKLEESEKTIIDLKDQIEHLELQLKKKQKGAVIASNLNTKDDLKKKKTIDKDLSSKVKKQYKKEIKRLKTALKKTKTKLKKAKAEKKLTREIEITKSIDIETLKKLLDKVPLKKVSERVVKRK